MLGGPDTRDWRAYVLIFCALGVAGFGLHKTHRRFEALRERDRDHPPLHSTPLYDRMQAMLASDFPGIPEVGFDTDRPPAGRALARRLHAVQFVAAPKILIHDWDMGSVMRRFQNGYLVVCDYADAKKLDERIALFKGWAEGMKIKHEVRRLDALRAILATHVGESP